MKLGWKCRRKYKIEQKKQVEEISATKSHTSRHMNTWCYEQQRAAFIVTVW